ncbi:MAG TPA: hypothetical protein DDW78_06135 [Treponema sp.]|nr:hypothetical protein [Treponema sp.]
MDIVFAKAADGSMTCTCKSIRLHSAYKPGHEAERFVQSISCDFTPGYVTVTGPALSYCIPYFKQRFPSAKLCAIRYAQEFSSTDNLWDKVFYAADTAVPLSEQLFMYMGEEGLASCLFVSWQPSEKAFPDAYEASWKAIKSAVIKSRNILATRSFFAKRWAKNALRFCHFAKQTARIQAGDAPVLICASGPSLKASLPLIRRHRDSFFLIAVSSALQPLVHEAIIPDICISTDGGYWAKLHLAAALQAHPEIVLALPAEAACYAQAFSHTIVPLSYGDGISETLLQACGFAAIHAERNGTVSGTAAQLALSLTSGDVFFCGLDLAPSSGAAHTAPNALECFHAPADCRLRTQETRTAPATFPSASLSLYADWFAAQDFGGRLFRLSDHYRYRNSLGSIQDISWESCERALSRAAGKRMPRIERNMDDPDGRTIVFLQEIVRKNLGKAEWLREAYTADNVLLERSRGTAQEAALRHKLHEKMSLFCEDIMRALGSSGTGGR